MHISSESLLSFFIVRTLKVVKRISLFAFVSELFCIEFELDFEFESDFEFELDFEFEF